MLRIYDNRRTNLTPLRYIEINGFFLYDDVLCRRVAVSDDFKVTADGVPYMEMPCGKVDLMDMETNVLPIRDEQIELCIEDCG